MGLAKIVHVLLSRSSCAQHILDCLALQTLSEMRSKARILPENVSEEMDLVMRRPDFLHKAAIARISDAQLMETKAELEGIFQACKAAVALSVPEGWTSFVERQSAEGLKTVSDATAHPFATATV